VKPPWQEDVRAQLIKIGMTEKDFAKRVGCAQSTMHDLLNKQPSKGSSLVPRVHEVLGWDPPPDPQSPSPPLPSPDAIEMAHLFDRLPEAVKRTMRDQAKSIIEAIQPNKPDDGD
jgi:lambda repressor-like predicted transcriptional regulator